MDYVIHVVHFPSHLIPVEQYIPFHPHNELLYQIKLSLNNSRKDPDIRIEIPFDRYVFGGGLQQRGKFLKKYRGHDVYGIGEYGDLTPILGKRWHVRVLNEQMDFCYVELKTVQYYLHYRQPIPDLQPDLESQYVYGGCILVFRFVRGDGVQSHSVTLFLLYEQYYYM